jgi:hypothetical protein
MSERIRNVIALFFLNSGSSNVNDVPKYFKLYHIFKLSVSHFCGKVLIYILVSRRQRLQPASPTASVFRSYSIYSIVFGKLRSSKLMSPIQFKLFGHVVT